MSKTNVKARFKQGDSVYYVAGFRASVVEVVNSRIESHQKLNQKTGQMEEGYFPVYELQDLEGFTLLDIPEAVVCSCQAEAVKKIISRIRIDGQEIMPEEVVEMLHGGE